MKYIPQNTLAYYHDAPQRHLHDVSMLPIAVFSAATKLYRETCDETDPHDNAVDFYTADHCASFVRTLFTAHEPLPAWAQEVMQEYLTLSAEQGMRMLHYVLSICAREMRHLKPETPTEMFVHLHQEFGMAMKSFIKQLMTFHAPQQCLDLYMGHPPLATTGEFIDAMAYAFHHGGFGGGYGGPAWGVVADAAAAMIHGNTSMDMFVDTGYALAHNGGPIFNKGMMYDSVNQDRLLTILDVQRSGQMPDLMLEAQHYIAKTVVATKVAQLIATTHPKTFKGWVNWEMVEAMRPQEDKDKSPHKYDTHIAKQKQLHPDAPAVVVPPKATFLHGQKVQMTGTWAVSPSETVKTYVRVTS